MEEGQKSFELLKTIKGLIFRFDGQKYHPHALVDACDRFHKFFQGREMTNSQYLAQFKSLVSVIEQYDGTIGVHKGMVRLEVTKSAADPSKPSPGEILKAEIVAKNKFLAVKFISAADKIRYGDLQTDLKNDFSKGHNSYPTDITTAYALLTTWQPRYDPPKFIFPHRTLFA